MNSELKCDYCKLKGNTREKYYKLIGYPPGCKFNTHRKKGFNNQSSAYNAMTKDEFINRVGGVVPIIQGLTNTLYLELMQMMDKVGMTAKAKEQDNTPIDSANMAGPLQWQGEGDW